MFKTFTCAALLWALQTPSCIEQLAGPPEQVAARAAAEFKPYFPNVKAEADPDQKAITINTCTQGLGTEVTKFLDQEIAKRLEANPDLQKLRSLEVSFLELFGERVPYDHFMVGFEDHILIWYRSDGSVRRHDLWVHISFEDSKTYIQEYQDECGFSLREEREEMWETLQLEAEKLIAGEIRIRFSEPECDALAYVISALGGKMQSKKNETLRQLWRQGGCAESEVQK